MKDFARRITSRKFLVAVAAFATALSQGEATLATIVAAVYVAAQAYVDAQVS